MQRRLHKKRGLFSALLPVIFVIMVIYLIFSLVYGQLQISAKKQQLEAVQASLADQISENDELSRQLESSDDELMEQAARDELGYAKPNERVFVDMSGK